MRSQPSEGFVARIILKVRKPPIPAKGIPSPMGWPNSRALETFRQSSQISSQTGLIGYLRADMDTDGNGFFSSWNDYRKDLKTDEFKQEFDEVINSLREEGDILHNRKDLAYYCYTNPQSKMPTEQDYYGVRVDTDKYAYLLRLNPNKGEYNLYCYCYVKDWLNGHMKDAAKGIRFINSHYKELFRNPEKWRDGIRTLPYVPETMAAKKLMHTFMQQKKSIGVVVDECQ